MRTPIPWMFQSTCSLPPDRSLLRRSEAPWIPRCSQGGLERSKEALEARQGQPAICARTWCSHSLTLMLSVLWCLCKSVNSTFDIIWYDHTSYDMTIRSHATVFWLHDSGGWYSWFGKVCWWQAGSVQKLQGCRPTKLIGMAYSLTIFFPGYGISRDVVSIPSGFATEMPSLIWAMIPILCLNT